MGIGIDYDTVLGRDGGRSHVDALGLADIYALMALAAWTKRHAPLPLLAIHIRPGHVVVDGIALSARPAVHSTGAVDLGIDGGFLLRGELDREHDTRRIDEAACKALTGGRRGQRPGLLIGKIRR